MVGMLDGAREPLEEGENVVNIRLDPFVQPPILKAFFKQLPLEALAKCRLVSKLWWELSLPTWRSRSTLKLKFEEGMIVSTRDDDDGSRRTTSLEEFLDLWEAGDWGSCPFKTFYLDSWNFRPEDVEQERFLELVGGHVTSLTLRRCSFAQRDHFRRILYTAFPKLKFLRMIGCEVNNIRYAPTERVLTYTAPAFGAHGLKSLELSRCCPHSTMDLFSHFDKINSLHMSKVSGRDYRNLLETIRLIKEHDKTKLPLRNFDVQFTFELGQSAASSMALLKLQEQLNLPLQRLDICFSWSSGVIDESNKDVIRDVLRPHTSTLTHLQFYRGDLYQFGHHNPFPFGTNLEKLEELILPSHFSDNFNYLRQTPNLCVLKIMYNSLIMRESDELFSNSEQLEIGDWTLPKLTELKLHIPVSDCSLRKLMRWMPNVERLAWLELDNSKFSLICNNWKNLKSLDDYGTALTDKGVVGVGAPNIAELKKLISFGTSGSRLTSASVRDGFLKLVNLKELSLGRFTKLDDEAKAALGERKIALRLC